MPQSIIYWNIMSFFERGMPFCRKIASKRSRAGRILEGCRSGRCLRCSGNSRSFDGTAQTRVFLFDIKLFIS